MEVTPNCVPYWVVLPKLKVMFIGSAPSAGVKPSNVRFAARRCSHRAGAGEGQGLRAADLRAVHRHVDVPEVPEPRSA